MHGGLAAPEWHMNNVDLCIDVEKREPGQVRPRPDPGTAECQIRRLRGLDELFECLRFAAIDRKRLRRANRNRNRDQIIEERVVQLLVQRRIDR